MANGAGRDFHRLDTGLSAAFGSTQVALCGRALCGEPCGVNKIMPIYDYQCSDCGPFRMMRPMAQSNAPTTCPTCGRVSTKTITAPFLADMAPHNRIGSQRNEKSAHAPR